MPQTLRMTARPRLTDSMTGGDPQTTVHRWPLQKTDAPSKAMARRRWSGFDDARSCSTVCCGVSGALPLSDDDVLEASRPTGWDVEPARSERVSAAGKRVLVAVNDAGSLRGLRCRCRARPMDDVSPVSAPAITAREPLECTS